MNASGIMNVSVEEIQVATNNLGESNFIGEGTAGMSNAYDMCVYVFVLT